MPQHRDKLSCGQFVSPRENPFIRTKILERQFEDFLFYYKTTSYACGFIIEQQPRFLTETGAAIFTSIYLPPMKSGRGLPSFSHWWYSAVAANSTSPAEFSAVSTES